MANTTFSGPVRSEGGFTSISKNATTGAITTQSSISSAGVSSFDANTMAVEAGTGITTGDATDADYTAGKLFIELMGYEA